MFKFVIVSVLLGLVAADRSDHDAEIVNFINTPADAEGNYAFAFDTTNQITVQESGNIAGVNGAAKWVTYEGEPIQLAYTADENGYHPQGDHLPTPPPTPDYILKSIEYINSHPAQEEVVSISQNPYKRQR